MCLKIEKNDDFERKMKSNKTKEITCWKIYHKHEYDLSSAVQDFEIPSWGVVKSDRISKKVSIIENEYLEIISGIHVFLSKKDAEEYIPYHLREEGKTCVIVPVTCQMNDYVASGLFHSGHFMKDFNTAVFMKVRIRSRTWNKIFNK